MPDATYHDMIHSCERKRMNKPLTEESDWTSCQ